MGGKGLYATFLGDEINGGHQHIEPIPFFFQWAFLNLEGIRTSNGWFFFVVSSLGLLFCWDGGSTTTKILMLFLKCAYFFILSCHTIRHQPDRHCTCCFLCLRNGSKIWLSFSIHCARADGPGSRLGEDRADGELWRFLLCRACLEMVWCWAGQV